MSKKTKTKTETKTETTIAPVSAASLLDALVNVSREGKTRAPREGKTNIIALPNVTDAHAASLRRLADDIYSGRTFIVKTNDGDVEFLSPENAMTRWSDLTPLKTEENAKTFRASLVNVRMIAPQGMGKMNIVMLSPDVRDRLAKTFHVPARPMTDDEKTAILKMEDDSRRAAEKMRRLRGSLPSDARVIPFASEENIRKMLTRRAPEENAPKT